MTECRSWSLNTWLSSHHITVPATPAAPVVAHPAALHQEALQVQAAHRLGAALPPQQLVRAIHHGVVGARSPSACLHYLTVFSQTATLPLPQLYIHKLLQVHMLPDKETVPSTALCTTLCVQRSLLLHCSEHDLEPTANSP